MTAMESGLIPFPNVSERGLKALNSIEESGLTLLEVKISYYSPVRGKRLKSLELPEQVYPLCIIRGGETIHHFDRLFLTENDRVVVFTNQPNLVREIFTGWQWEERISGTALAAS